MHHNRNVHKMLNKALTELKRLRENSHPRYRDRIDRAIWFIDQAKTESDIALEYNTSMYLRNADYDGDWVIVSGIEANLHDDLLSRLNSTATTESTPLYAASYRPVVNKDRIVLEIWHEALKIDGELPIMPLGLLGGLVIPIDLNTTYERTCKGLRIT